MSIPPMIIIAYNIYKCFTTEPGIIPRGDLPDPEVEAKK